MNNTVINKKNPLKCGIAIKILAIISLVCTEIGCFIDLLAHSDEPFNSLIYPIHIAILLPFDGIYYPFSPYVALFLTIVPHLLLIIYIFCFHSKLKATVIVPIIFTLLSLEMIGKVLWVRGGGNGIISLLLGKSLGGIIFLLINLTIIVFCILAVISAFKGLNNKVFTKIAMSLYLSYEAILLISIFSMPEYRDFYYEFYPALLTIIGYSLFYIALLLFATKNKIPSIISRSPEKEKKKTEQMNPEQELKLLKDKLDLDMISEEEYQAQRAEIISKL